MENRKTARTLLVSLTMILSLFLLGACSKTGAEDTNKDVIQKVLELQFDGTDDEFMDLVLNPEHTTIVENKEVNESLDQYIDKVYGPYFTDFYLESFLNTFGLLYPTSAYLSKNKLNLKDVSIMKDEKIDNRYTFTAAVGYLNNDGEEKFADVSGLVLFSTEEAGKIGKFEYHDDDGLLDDLNKQIN